MYPSSFWSLLVFSKKLTCANLCLIFGLFQIILSVVFLFFFPFFFPKIRPEALQVDQKSTCNEIAGREIVAGGIKLHLPQVGFFTKKK